jgi:uncharacterized protein (DUF2062 family)
MKTNSSEHSIALGFAVGTLINILPIPLFNFLVALLVILIFKKLNKLSLFVALAVWNVFTLLPVYYLSYKIGNFLFDSTPIVKYNIVILDQIYNFSRRYLIGNAILALIISPISYFIVKKIVRVYRKRKKN